MQTITLVGTGYVGLGTGAYFAEMGNKVWCIDNDDQKVKKLNAGTIPIYEPSLKELVKKNTERNNLFFTTYIKKGIEKSQICFIAISTAEKMKDSGFEYYCIGRNNND